jgi:response regulator NasT
VAGALASVVAMAAGVLMHRYSIARGEAPSRLRSLADAEQPSIGEQAERIVSAVEELAGTSRST